MTQKLQCVYRGCSLTSSNLDHVKEHFLVCEHQPAPCKLPEWQTPGITRGNEQQHENIRAMCQLPCSGGCGFHGTLKQIWVHSETCTLLQNFDNVCKETNTLAIQMHALTDELASVIERLAFVEKMHGITPSRDKPPVC
jgi:hypothetical protein